MCLHRFTFILPVKVNENIKQHAILIALCSQQPYVAKRKNLAEINMNILQKNQSTLWNL